MWHFTSARRIVIQAGDSEGLNLGSGLRKTEVYMASREHHLTCQLQLPGIWTAHGYWQKSTHLRESESYRSMVFKWVTGYQLSCVSLVSFLSLSPNFFSIQWSSNSFSRSQKMTFPFQHTHTQSVIKSWMALQSSFLFSSTTTLPPFRISSFPSYMYVRAFQLVSCFQFAPLITLYLVALMIFKISRYHTSA